MAGTHPHDSGPCPEIRPDAVPGVYEAGRVVFPLFGIVLAYNLARVQSHDRAVYLRVLTRLLVCGVIASINHAKNFECRSIVI